MAEMDDFRELRMALQRVARSIRRNRDRGITDSHLAVLFRLEARDHSPGELADLELVTPPSMNRTLNCLEQAGHIERHRDAQDARRVRVTITAAGGAAVRETRALRTEWFSERMQMLDPGERAILEAALPVLHRIADV